MPMASVTSSCSPRMPATAPCETILRCVGSCVSLEVQVVVGCSLLVPHLIPQTEAFRPQLYPTVRGPELWDGVWLSPQVFGEACL